MHVVFIQTTLSNQAERRSHRIISGYHYNQGILPGAQGAPRDLGNKEGGDLLEATKPQGGHREL